MDLRKAMETVIEDVLQDNQGGISYEDLDLMSKIERKVLAMKLVESDEFLIRFTEATEDFVAQYLDEYADEYGVYQ